MKIKGYRKIIKKKLMK